MAQPIDHTRAIIASLFTAPPGQAPNESHIGHVQTFEPVPGTNQVKPRFLILAAGRDSRLKLHKAKQNANGSFSIGKTWALEELRTVEVIKALEFALVISGKTYRYETNLPSSQQAAFLVTCVRCWRRYMQGRGQPDLNLIGFSVDSPQPNRPQPSALSPPSSGAPPPSASRPPPQAQSSLRNEAYPREQPPPSSASSFGRGPPPSQSHSSSFGRQGGGPPPLSSSQTSSQQTYSPGPPQMSSAPRPSNASSTYSTRPSSPPPPSGQRKVSGPTTLPPNTRQQPLATPPTRPLSAVRSGSTSSSSGVPPPMAPSQSSGGPLQRLSRSGLSNGAGVGPNDRPLSSSSSRDGPRPSSLFNTAPIQGSQGTTAQTLSSAGGLGIGMGRIKSSAGAIETASAAPPMPTAPLGPKQRRMSTSSTKSNSGPPPKGPPTPSEPVPPVAQARKQSAPSNQAQVEAAQAVAVITTKQPNEDDQLDDDTVLSNVEEMLEGFEWRGGGGGGWGNGNASGGRGKADEIEKRLVGELKALEAASIHAIMESDDRVNFVVKHLDDALAELDRLDLTIGLYKTQLNLMTDDIAHIESQNRGLQVQTSNQRMLLAELDKLMSTIHIPDADLSALSQESLENAQGIERLERAAVSLYKALLSTRDTPVGDMAAASERVGEYRNKAAQFCKRVFDFLGIMFKFQVDQILNQKEGQKPKPGSLPDHSTLEEFLGRYCGLMLFVKEIDYAMYQKICAAYFGSMADLHRKEIGQLFAQLKAQIRKASEEELEASFSARESPTIRQQSIRRVGGVVNRSPMLGGDSRKDGGGKGGVSAGEAFRRALEQLGPHILREHGFISDFLHINDLDASITFADYMVLETFFRRGATSYLASQQGKLKDINSAMGLVFGFLEGEIKDWIDGVVRADNMQLVGILAALDRAIALGIDNRNEFLTRTLQKQYQKCIALLDRSIKDQTKAIEQTKLTLKKRKGVVPFVRIFPAFVSRVESQLDGADNLPVRNVVNVNYERIAGTMFECLQQMAKMDGEGQGQSAEDKDQLNYHVILIENMHHITAVFAKEKVNALATFVGQAREKYTTNLEAYIKLILRRPLARPLDFFNGLEQLLRTTPPTEVSLHSAYTRSALKRTLSDLRAKDIRKAIDALFKRVDKHFGVDVASPSAGQGDVLKTVWRATEDELQRLTSGWRSLIDKCYPDDRVQLEFTKDDVHDMFAKAQFA